MQLKSDPLQIRGPLLLAHDLGLGEVSHCLEGGGALHFEVLAAFPV